VNGSQFRLVVVDDYEPWRSFISSALMQHLESCVICEAKDGFEAVQFAADLQPDLVTMDLGLPRLNGIEAARQIRERSPNTKILFISENRSREMVEAALAAGGMGYVVKSDAAELLGAVDSVMRGRRYISQSLARKMKKSGALSLCFVNSIG
jgi:DNA-binding NarL/FixJ family response regulator